MRKNLPIPYNPGSPRHIGTWPVEKLGEVITKSEDWIQLDPVTTYKELSVRLWGRGVVPRGEVLGSEVGNTRRIRVRAGQFILSRIDARNGALGLVPEDLDGAVVSNDFPAFHTNPERLLPEFLGWLSRTKAFVDSCRSSSEGTTNRVRLKEERFYEIEIPLPPLSEQRVIVEKIERLAGKIEEARNLRQSIDHDQQRMLLSFFWKIASGVPKRPMSDVAPLIRRPVTIDPEEHYPQVAVRSFGKGTFHKPALSGSEVTWQRVQRDFVSN